MKSDTAKARVNLAVAPNGKWYCYGYSDCKDDDARGVIDGMATDEPHLAWKVLVAEIEFPQVQEVEAHVET